MKLHGLKSGTLDLNPIPNSKHCQPTCCLKPKSNLLNPEQTLQSLADDPSTHQDPFDPKNLERVFKISPRSRASPILMPSPVQCSPLVVGLVDHSGRRLHKQQPEVCRMSYSANKQYLHSPHYEITMTMTIVVMMKLKDGPNPPTRTKTPSPEP